MVKSIVDILERESWHKITGTCLYMVKKCTFFQKVSSLVISAHRVKCTTILFKLWLLIKSILLKPGLAGIGFFDPGPGSRNSSTYLHDKNKKVVQTTKINQKWPKKVIHPTAKHRL